MIFCILQEQGCEVGDGVWVGVGRSRQFWPESESESILKTGAGVGVGVTEKSIDSADQAGLRSRESELESVGVDSSARSRSGSRSWFLEAGVGVGVGVGVTENPSNPHPCAGVIYRLFCPSYLGFGLSLPLNFTLKRSICRRYLRGNHDELAADVVEQFPGLYIQGPASRLPAGECCVECSSFSCFQVGICHCWASKIIPGPCAAFYSI